MFAATHGGTLTECTPSKVKLADSTHLGALGEQTSYMLKGPNETKESVWLQTDIWWRGPVWSTGKNGTKVLFLPEFANVFVKISFMANWADVKVQQQLQQLCFLLTLEPAQLASVSLTETTSAKMFGIPDEIRFCPEKGVKVEQESLTQLVGQVFAFLRSHNSLLIHVALVAHHDDLGIVPRVRLDLSGPKSAIQTLYSVLYFKHTQDMHALTLEPLHTSPGRHWRTPRWWCHTWGWSPWRHGSRLWW